MRNQREIRIEFNQWLKNNNAFVELLIDENNIIIGESNMKRVVSFNLGNLLYI